MPSLSAWSLGTATLAGNKVAGTRHVSPNGVHNLPIGGHPGRLREREAVLCQRNCSIGAPVPYGPPALSLLNSTAPPSTVTSNAPRLRPRRVRHQHVREKA